MLEHVGKSDSTLCLTTAWAVASDVLQPDTGSLYLNIKRLLPSASRKSSEATLVNDWDRGDCANDTMTKNGGAAQDTKTTGNQGQDAANKLAQLKGLSNENPESLKPSQKTTSNNDSNTCVDKAVRTKLPPATLESVNASLRRFSAPSPSADVYLVQTPTELCRLLDFAADQPPPALTEVFPFLHGLDNLRQRVYFHEKFDPAADLLLLSLDGAKLRRKFPHSTDVVVPDVSHFMVVDSLELLPVLANSVNIDDLLVPRAGQEGHFEPFLLVYQLSANLDAELANRSYCSQILLLALLLHFVVYNTDGDIGACLDAAALLAHLMAPRGLKNIYVVSFDVRSPQARLSLALHLEASNGSSSSSSSTTTATTTTKFGGSGISRSAFPLDDTLPRMEQNLIWLLNGLKELFPRLYLGNVQTLQQRRLGHDFAIHVYCHERATLPSITELTAVLTHLESGDGPITVEFPDMLSRFGHLSYRQVALFLCTLKVLNLAVNYHKRKVLAYLYDGFTGITLLSLCLGLLWGSDHVEDVATSIFRKPGFKFHCAKEEFGAVKSLEPYIQWIKRQPLQDRSFSFEVEVEKASASYRVFSKKLDWFRTEAEVNFPSLIYDNFYLGSVAHASSLAVLHAMNITKLITIDERPSWFDYLSIPFSHEVTNGSPALKPIYSFNNNQTLVYEIPFTPNTLSTLFTDISKIPRLSSAIYIHNLRDDGRDSILPLLLDCLEQVQRKILWSPRENQRAMVHCRIGVLRSASLAIALMMKHFNMGLLEAYTFVRVRRFNVIIQPNLRIFYELFMYDAALKRSRGEQSSLSWWVLCEQIHRLNLAYVQG